MTKVTCKQILLPPPQKKSLNKKDWKAAFGKVVSSDSLGVFKKKLIVWFLQWV